MKLILQVTSGPDAPRSFIIDPGEEVRVGRAAPAEILLAGDGAMSRLHFAVQCDARSCRIRDLDSTHGTTINGEAISTALLSDGDLIVAGATCLRAILEEGVSPAGLRGSDESSRSGQLPMDATGVVGTQEQAVLSERGEVSVRDHVLRVLRSLDQPLFAILDSARDPRVYLAIHDCPETKQSLYDGNKASEYAFVAPYLLSLPSDATFLDRIVREGWGQSWGVFLVCDRPFEEVRRQLRRFLTVELEGQPGKRLFRFYDPRVLRVFLPTCTPEEAEAFFGPIQGFLMESPGADEMLEFVVRDKQLRQRSMALESALNQGNLAQAASGRRSQSWP